jgi:peptide/nickel transport system permease protein
MRRRTLRYIMRRLAFVPFQLLGVLLVTFLLIRLLPGDPATEIAGQLATKSEIATINHNLGLDQPVLVQFLIYVRNLLSGNLGRSWYTSNTVAADLGQRLPATLELVILSLIIAFILGTTLGVLASTGRRRGVRAGFTLYGLLSGSFPDFWIGLALILIFFAKLGWAPAPLGQLDLAIDTPHRITGMILIDALIQLQWPAVLSALTHLILPVTTLTFVYMAPIIRMTKAMMDETLPAPFMLYARACGVSRRLTARYALRAALPAVLTQTAVVFGFLIGGAVLVETVFSWGGIGQYAVQSIANSDFSPIQGVVLVAALLNLTLYLVVDLSHFALDPRLRG